MPLKCAPALVVHRVERRVDDDLVELVARQQELAVAVADVALRRLLAARRQQLRLDPLLVEQRRPRLEAARPGQRERERQPAADHGEQRDQPPVAPGLATEVQQALHLIARSYRWKRHL